MPIKDMLLYAPLALSAALYILIVVLYRISVRMGRSEPSYRSNIHFSILKPLAGADDELEENLESFAALVGAHYELLLGVASVDDPAYAVAGRFVESHRMLSARVVVTDPNAAPNPKVAQLIGLERWASGDVIVISDSNVRVESDYLLHLAAALEEPGTHLVSTLVRGAGERTFGARMENTILATHVAPSVAAGYMLTDRAITIGKSMAMWRMSLRRVGGFACVADRLAEDHVLGQVFAEAGLGVRVIPHFVENRNAQCSLVRSYERHVRWAKIRRNIEPLGYAFEPLLWPSVIALAPLLIDPSRTAGVAFAAALALQGAGGMLMVAQTDPRRARLSTACFEWMRSLFLFLCWLEGWMSRSVDWRGHRLTIGPGTRIEMPKAPAQSHEVASPGYRAAPAPVRAAA